MGAVGQNLPHDSAVGHVSGVSVFLDDVPSARNELLVDVVGSPVARGRLKGVDFSKALEVPGVVAIYTHKDIPGHNHFGPVIKDEHLLANDELFFVGDPIVLIAAESRSALRAARKHIKIDVEELPPIFSIDDAIAAGSYIAPQRLISRGDAEGAMNAAEQTLEGTFVIGGQEHFYLESQVAIAIPGEYGQIVVHSSTQHPTEVQSIVAEILGVSFNKVVVICKRMGGGFGGKETQAAQPAAMAAMVASLTGRPTRVAYNKDDDMRITGKRHPFQARYKVGFDSAGLITALKVDLFSNGGCTTDLSLAVLERAMLHSDNAYYLPNVRITGRVCKTNLPSNTAFRGFGGPQGVAAVENIIQEIAHKLGKDSLDIRQANAYGITERNETPYGQIVRNNVIAKLISELRDTSEYNQRRKDIAAFNASSKTHLRGLALTPVKFGISFTKRTLNQANALVNIYTDGTVMVSTGGTEMGQGLYARVRQIVAEELGISYDDVVVAPTSTDKNNNTSPTAASSGTDLNGAAAAVACKKLKENLATFAAPLLADNEAGLPASVDHVVFADGYVSDDRKPDRKMRFAELICRAYMDRVNLGERGFYATPGVDFNRETGKGTPFLYYTNGAAVSEVLIDRFTGEIKVTRADILMDAGIPLNPGIDRGQVIGGYIQGMGWVTTEELKYNSKGHLLSHSPTTYKIPNISDLPETLNMAFFNNPDSTASIYRSKALGEPPLLLGLSVWAAVKDAIGHLYQTPPKFDIPATGEQILMAIARAKKTVPFPAVVG